jgi:hypothetical protein
VREALWEVEQQLQSVQRQKVSRAEMLSKLQLQHTQRMADKNAAIDHLTR